MATNSEKLRSLLEELFQLDQADLDFGIYRIMNTKRDEIVRFLNKDLLPQVQDAFKHYKSADKSVLQGELDKLVASVQNAGMNPEESPKVKELRQQIAESAVDVTALENEVFSHLFSFFRRYYSEGDFISLRRYKEGVYAIPYEGEEVKLHWANADQYFVKSSENFRDYTFRIAGGKRVRVHIVAASTEQDNNKAAPGKERRFVLADNPLTEENGELFIRFEYRSFDGKEKQDDLNKQAIEAVLKTPGFDQWAQELGKFAPTEKKKDRTVLEKHLTQSTARNTFDYFIHKDLGSFLRRELDFYIKNEVMHLDDIEHQSAPKVEQYLSQIKVIRSIAHKIIAFVAQLENFQKKLWLKKKFVIETNYCITLDRVPESLYPEIVANDDQREEWVRLFAIDEIEKDLHQPEYSKPMKVAFLKAHPHLVLDTKHFDKHFIDRVLASITDIDEALDGIAIHSDNFQAMNLVYSRFHDSARTIYIDPPYNTGDGDFPYKDSYQHSSWLAMMDAHLSLARNLLANDGSFICHIDEHEFSSLDRLLSLHFGEQENIGPIVWDKRNPKGDATGIATQHEYIAWAVKCFEALKAPENALSRQKKNARAILDKAVELIRKQGGPTDKMKGDFKTWIRGQDFSGGEKPYCEVDENGDVYRPVSMAWPNKQNAPDEYFEPLIHPTTRQPCPVPSRGWRNPPRTMKDLLDKKLILFGRDHTTQPTRKYLLKDNTAENVPSLLYFGGSDDDLQADMGYSFPNPKPLHVAQYIISISANQDKDIVFDCFAGSGTVGHGVIGLRRNTDQVKRRFVLIEMGQYFQSVMLGRLKKAIYSDTWKAGAPQSHSAGLSFTFKYFQLESYEDALNNLELKRTDKQGMFLDADAEMREQYILSYMLDVESRGSQSLLNIEAFRNPDEYKLRVERNGETQLVNVDLVETFNWLLGLTVKHIDVIRGVRVVEGTNPKGDRVLVLWRNIDQMVNDALDKWFQKQDYNTREMVYDLFYVNGDNNLKNLRRPDQTWKVRLIEEEFQRLMFDLEDV